MRVPAVAAALLLAACSSGTRTASTSSPSPLASTSPTPAVTASSGTTPTPSPRASRTPSPAARRTASPTPAATRSPRPSPRPSPTPPKPSPTYAGKTYGIKAGPGLVFNPDVLTIRVGDRIKVANGDLATHHDFHAAGHDSPDLAPGQSWTSLTFTKAGTFTFVCSYHQSSGMTGTLTVRA